MLNGLMNVPVGVASQFCVKIVLNGFEISLSMDNSCGAWGPVHGRPNTRVFLESGEKFTGADVTYMFEKSAEAVCDGPTLLELMLQVSSHGK